MKKIAISLPVHQSADVIENQMQNIQKFVPNSTVILHVSADSPSLWKEIMKWQPKYDGFVFLNPVRHRTYAHDQSSNVKSLSTVHAENVKFAAAIGRFDIMAFNTSNDMFVRKGIEHDFENYELGMGGTLIDPEWFPSKQNVDELRMVAKIDRVIKTPQEGFFVRFDCAKFFSDKIFELMNRLGKPMSAEEGFLANLCIAADYSILDKNTGNHYVYHDWTEGASVKTEMIYKVRNGEMPHIFAVKRVPRTIDHPTRILVNELTKND